MTAASGSGGDQPLEFLKIERDADFPPWGVRSQIERFFHETMKPYHDSLENVEAALDYALVPGKGQGGFLMLCHRNEQLLGALAMLETGMKGYVPEHILLFVSIDPQARGQGVGRKLIGRALRECPGDVKLHVEHENPAKRLYERMGFTSKYAEMRLRKKTTED